MPISVLLVHSVEKLNDNWFKNSIEEEELFSNRPSIEKFNSNLLLT